MRKTLFNTLLVTGLVGATFWFGPTPPERPLPAPPLRSATLSPLDDLAVDLVDGATDADLQEIEDLLDQGLGVDVDLDWTSPLSKDEALAEGFVTDAETAIALLSGHPLVEVVEVVVTNGIVPEEPRVVIDPGASATSYPNDPLYQRQWHMREMGAPAGWANTPRGKGIVVAIVDTGVTKVEDLQGTKILEGASFVPGSRTAADDQGHGTHVAGTIAQTTNNGKGTTGVAPDAAILPVKVLSKFGFGSSTWIASGIDYAVDEGADVINLSLGGGYSAVIHNAIKKARAKGVVVVAAAGNSGREGVSYPGALAETIGVSALGPGGSLAPYSSWGKGVDVSAPGGDKNKPGGGVLQDTIDGKGGHQYVEFQGTSMATPHVAGAVAVLLSAGVPADAVQRVLLDSAEGKGWDAKYGHGRLDLAAALGMTHDRHGALRFALGVLLALLVSQLAGTATGSFARRSAAVAGVTAGGLFFLSWLPLPNNLVLELASEPFLNWPAVLLGPGFMHFPLWLSAGLPILVAFVAGPTRLLRPWALGFAAGVGAHLFHGAATGTLQPSFLPASLGWTWLIVNGTLCVLLAMSLAGVEKLEQK